jgi:hypothetical protein
VVGDSYKGMSGLAKIVSTKSASVPESSSKLARVIRANEQVWPFYIQMDRRRADMLRHLWPHAVANLSVCPLRTAALNARCRFWCALIPVSTTFEQVTVFAPPRSNCDDGWHICQPRLKSQKSWRHGAAARDDAQQCFNAKR